jgi:hypothetical protein
MFASHLFTVLNDSHFQSHHTYTLEWQPPNSDKGEDGYLEWYLDDELIMSLPGSSLSLTGAVIPEVIGRSISPADSSLSRRNPCISSLTQRCRIAGASPSRAIPRHAQSATSATIVPIRV